MQANAIPALPRPGEVGYETFLRRLRALLAQINAMQDLARTDEDGDEDEQPAPDMQQMRQGLRTLEEMASELLYQLEAVGDEVLLAVVPGVSLSEALTQLVEATADELGLSLSSRVIVSGRGGRQLADYPARLLYRIAQEALARVPEHAGARRLRFNLDYRRGEIVMGLEDDGVPSDENPLFSAEPGADATLPFLAANSTEADTASSGQIMRRLRAMVERIGGILEMNRSVEQGVQLHVHVPFNLPDASPASVPDSAQTPGSADVSMKINLLIVDGQAVSRAGLRHLLESYPDLKVVGEAGDHVQAVSETAELGPQVVLIDAQLPEGQSLEALRQLRQLNPEIRVLLLANKENETLLYEALRAGASGYILKNIAPDELAQAVRTVARGEVLVQQQLAARLLARLGGQERDAGGRGLQEHLTAREHEVLQLLARGLRNKEIAERLFVSERTVNFHLANIYAKLHVSGRTEALSKALEQGLIKV
jgi:DNA-binding NarL/FixJ family response regulator